MRLNPLYWKWPETFPLFLEHLLKKTYNFKSFLSLCFDTDENLKVSRSVCSSLLSCGAKLCPTLYNSMGVLVTQLLPALCNPMGCSLPGSYVHGVLQARTPEWVSSSFSRESSPPRDPNHTVAGLSHLDVSNSLQPYGL